MNHHVLKQSVKKLKDNGFRQEMSKCLPWICPGFCQSRGSGVQIKKINQFLQPLSGKGALGLAHCHFKLPCHIKCQFIVGSARGTHSQDLKCIHPDHTKMLWLFCSYLPRTAVIYSHISTSVTSISNTTSFLVMKGLSTPNYTTIKFLILNKGPIQTLLMSLETIPVRYLKIGFKKLKFLMFTSMGEIKRKVNST